MKKHHSHFNIGTVLPERMHALIPIDSVSVKNKQILARSQPFEMFYTLNCQNLCSDFHENLEFKFSWGITAMIQRFTGKVKCKPKALLYNPNASISVSIACFQLVQENNSKLI